MVYTKPLSHIPWEDQFRTPTVEGLRSHYDSQLCQLVETARKRLNVFEDVREEIQWMGLPWRWTLVYRCPDDPTQAWAYLVPHRDKPIIATPLTTEMMNKLPMSRLRKFIREGLDEGRRVNGTYWVAWEVVNKTHLDLVLELLKRKHKFIMAQN